jgi:hypothetical protein
MNDAAKNRRMVDLIHADKGTTRNNAGGGSRRKSEDDPPARPAPSGRKAKQRRRVRGVEGGRLLA